MCRKGLEMNLVHDWKRIIKKAWSVRLLIVAGLLSGIEVALTFADTTSDPRYVILPITGTVIAKGVFAFLSFVITAAALVSRIVAQPKMYEPDPRTDPLDVRINPIGRRK